MDAAARSRADARACLPGALALLAIATTRWYSSALFHALAVLFSVAVLFSMFTVVWHSRRHLKNGALLMLGSAAGAIVVIDTLHLLTYEGMNVIPGAVPDLSAQLWIAGRGFLAATLALSPRYADRPIRAWLVLATSMAVALSAIAIIASGLLPQLLGSSGLQTLKLLAEIAILALLAVSLRGFCTGAGAFRPDVARLLRGALAAMMTSQVFFMAFPDTTAVGHAMGHLAMIAATYMLYRAVVATTLEEPQATLFREISLRNARLEESERALRRAKAYSDAMSSISSTIARTYDMDAIVAHALEVAAGVMGADGAVMTVRERSRWVVTHAPGFDASVIGIERETTWGRHLCLAAEKRSPVIMNDPARDPRVDPGFVQRFGIRSMLVAPLVIGNDVIGALTFISRRERRTFTEQDRGFAGRLGVALGLAIENIRLYASEAQIAEALRAAILAMPDHLPGVTIGHAYRSADDVARIGGDFYDAFTLADGRHAVLMGDVSGKGIDAAMSSFVTRTTFHALALREPTPSRVMAAANAVLARLLPPEAFATAIFGVLDPQTGMFIAASAGHPDPLVCASGGCIEIDTVRNLPLGMFPDAGCDEFSLMLGPGQVLVLFSDGLLDARRGSDTFGETRVREFLDSVRHADPQEVAHGLLAQALAFSDGDHADDIAIVALRVDGA